jgi:hypothetical protein
VFAPWLLVGCANYVGFAVFAGLSVKLRDNRKECIVVARNRLENRRVAVGCAGTIRIV